MSQTVDVQPIGRRLSLRPQTDLPGQKACSKPTWFFTNTHILEFWNVNIRKTSANHCSTLPFSNFFVIKWWSLLSIMPNKCYFLFVVLFKSQNWCVMKPRRLWLYSKIFLSLKQVSLVRYLKDVTEINSKRNVLQGSGQPESVHVTIVSKLEWMRICTQSPRFTQTVGVVPRYWIGVGYWTHSVNGSAVIDT